MVAKLNQSIDLNTDPEWVEMQTKLAFQEDSMQQLSDVVAAQQQDIMKLQRQMSQLIKELGSVLNDLDSSNAGQSVGLEQKPPHY